MDNQNRRADDKRAPGQLQWGESVGAALAGAGFTATIAAAPVIVPDIVMHGLCITKDGITYNGKEIKDAGAVHAALMDVLSGKPLPPAAPSAASIEGLTRYWWTREGMETVEDKEYADTGFYLAAHVDRLLATQSAKQGARQELPALLFDGNAVYDEVLCRSSRTSAENVADVLDAVVRLMRKEGIEQAAKQGAQPSPLITPKHIEEISDVLLWPVTEDDARTARDMLQSLHFDLSMAEPVGAAPAAQVQADVRDAERYRWLRDQRGIQGDLPIDGDVWVVQFRQPQGVIPELRCAGFGVKLDAAIDVAMQSKRAASTDGEARDA